MLAFDLPPPAIIIPKPVAEWRLIVNDGREWDCGPCLPRDFREMPTMLRAAVSADEIRRWLPEPYRKLSDGMLWSLVLGNVPALPSAIVAGGAKYGWLFTATGSLTIPTDWNRYDNAIHCLSTGGNGQNGAVGSLTPTFYYGGGGGGGSAYAGLRNAIYAAAQIVAVTIATTCWFDSTSVLLAAPGANASALSGGVSHGGQGGQAASSVGNVVYSGDNGGDATGTASGGAGAYGGSAAGPHGPPSSIYADNGYGGHIGSRATTSDPPASGQDGIDGPGGGWNPDGPGENAGSGGGGQQGFSNAGFRNGGNGGKFGGGAAGGGSDPGGTGTGGTAGQGCVLAVNNASA